MDGHNLRSKSSSPVAEGLQALREQVLSQQSFSKKENTHDRSKEKKLGKSSHAIHQLTQKCLVTKLGSQSSLGHLNSFSRPEASLKNLPIQQIQEMQNMAGNSRSKKQSQAIQKFMKAKQ